MHYRLINGAVEEFPSPEPIKPAGLCAFCSKIDFSPLRLPLAVDVQNCNFLMDEDRYKQTDHFRETRWNLMGEPDVLPDDDVAPLDTYKSLSPLKDDQDSPEFGEDELFRGDYYLGKVSRLERNSSVCRLCDIIWRTMVSKRDAPSSKLSWGGDDEIIIAGFRKEYTIKDPQRQYDMMLMGPSFSEAEVMVLQIEMTTVEGLLFEEERNMLETHQFDDPDVRENICKFQAIQTSITASPQTQYSFDSFPEARTLGGGRKRPLRVDMDWLKNWIRLCDETHGKTCRLTDGHGPMRVKLIRFIDVVEGRISTFIDEDLSGFEYLALSYVWGKSQKLKLRLDNIDDLSKIGSITPDMVSLTVGDAIIVGQALGFRYLWCDALCIIQDDPDDKSVGIEAMADIYRAASLVIVDAAGTNANSGLPGIRPGTRFAEQDEFALLLPYVSDLGETITGLSMQVSCGSTPAASFGHHVRPSNWSSRGWTLQERFHSRRMLVFEEEIVHWHCTGAIFSEDLYLENIPQGIKPGDYKPSTLQGLITSFKEQNRREDRHHYYLALERLIHEYCLRDFTYDGDIHDGFSAVLENFKPLLEDSFLWGIPTSRFEVAVLWEVQRSFGFRRRTALSTLPMTAKHVRVHVPSWSWMGWHGDISMWTSYSGSNYVEPEILCYTHTTTPLTISRIRPSGPTASETTRRLDAALQSPSTFFAESRSKWKPVHDLTITLSDIQTEHPELASRLNDVPDTLFIFFWASSARLKLAGAKRKQLWNGDGKKIGSLSWNVNVEVDRDEMTEVIVVQGASGRSHYGVELGIWSIKWLDGIAYRVNVGDVIEEEWVKLDNRVWKLIPLG